MAKKTDKKKATMIVIKSRRPVAVPRQSTATGGVIYLSMRVLKTRRSPSK